MCMRHCSSLDHETLANNSACHKSRSPVALLGAAANVYGRVRTDNQSWLLSLTNVFPCGMARRPHGRDMNQQVVLRGQMFFFWQHERSKPDSCSCHVLPLCSCIRFRHSLMMIDAPQTRKAEEHRRHYHRHPLVPVLTTCSSSHILNGDPESGKKRTFTARPNGMEWCGPL